MSKSFLALLSLSMLFFNVAVANDRLLILKGEKVDKRLKESGFAVYASPDKLKALLEYNSIEKIDDDIALMIPPLECLEKERARSPLCSFEYARSLSYLDARFLGMKDDQTPIEFLDKLSQTKKNLRLLELGSGIGVLLIESQVRYPHSEVIGINYEPHSGVKDGADLERVAIFHKKSTLAQWRELKNKPRLIFKDLDQGDMSYFGNSSFDAVLSQSTLQYLSRKDIVLKEIYRILSPGGSAYLDLKNIRVDKNKSALESFQIFVNGLAKSNPKAKIFAPKDFRLIIKRPEQKGLGELVIPFGFVKSISAEKEAENGLYQEGDSKGLITYLKRIQ